MALLAFASLALPASAHELGSSEADREPDDTVTETREEALIHDAAIYAADFGVELDVAAKRLDDQPRIAEAIERLRGALGTSLAGVWIEHSPYRLVIKVTPAAPPEVSYAALVPSDLELSIFVDRSGVRSRSELERDFEAATDLLLESGVAWAGGVDVREGKVLITLPAELGTDELLRIPHRVWDLAEVSSAPRGVAPGREEHTYGGATTIPVGGSGWCTTGFTVKQGSTRGVLTAGHCLNNRKYVQPDGLEFNLYYQNQHKGTYGDAQWHTSSHYVYNKFFAYSNALRTVDDVYGFGDIYGGQYLCRFGRTTGQQCDTVYGWPFANGSALNLVGMDNDEALDGDSGGPWFDVDVAAGIHQGDIWLPAKGYVDLWTRASFLPTALGVTVWES